MAPDALPSTEIVLTHSIGVESITDLASAPEASNCAESQFIVCWAFTATKAWLTPTRDSCERITLADNQVLIIANDRARNSITSINVKPRQRSAIVLIAVRLIAAAGYRRHRRYSQAKRQ